MGKADLPSIFGLSVDQEETSIADHTSHDHLPQSSSKSISCNPATAYENPYAPKSRYPSASSSNPRHLLQRSSSCTIPTISPSSPHHNYEAADDDGGGDDDDQKKQSLLAMAAPADDGSVASRLLGAIGKSISSPSLSSCKEIALETPYQKSLKLRRMKLHHCTEELGSESCCPSVSLSQFEYDWAYPPQLHIEEEINPFLQSNGAQYQEGCASSPLKFALPRRLSAPNLCKLLTCKDSTTPISKRAFPPPIDSAPTLVHPSPSAETSFSSTLRSIKQDGRFVLKEVKVPIPQHSLRASRIAGRLTLYIAHPLPESNPTMSTRTFDQGETCKENMEQVLAQLPSTHMMGGHPQFKRTRGEEVEQIKEEVEKAPFPLKCGIGKHCMLESPREEDGFMDGIEEEEEEEEEDSASMPPNYMEVTSSVNFNYSDTNPSDISCKGLNEIDDNFKVFTLSKICDEVDGSSAIHNHDRQAASSSNNEIKPYLPIWNNNNLEWLRSMHCKDQPNVLIGKSFTKVHCVATRS